MTTATSTREVDDAGLELVLAPRDDLVLESADGAGAFSLVEGPFDTYRRTVVVEPSGDGLHRVTETVDFTIAIPIFGVIFRHPVRRMITRPPEDSGKTPWWSPPERLSARTTNVIGLLCGLSVIAAYVGTLLSQTNTFAGEEFGATDSQLGFTLAAVRVGVILALVLAWIADRQGRKRILIVSVVLGCVTAAITALSPSLAFYGATQTVSRAFSTAAAILLLVVAAEEMPRNSRAYAASVIFLSGGLGSGMVLWALPLADLGEAAWRLLFLVPLAMLPLVAWINRRLPESKRFVASEQTDLDDEAAHEPAAKKSHRWRLVLLATSAALGSLFFTPASQFFNQFLRDERNFSAAMITVFQITTNLPGFVGLVVGGRLADMRGRRLVGAVGIIGGVGATVVMYNTIGWPMWAWSLIGAVVGAAVVPALSVYGPELFPTSMRGRANGAISVLGVIGGATGLLTAGILSDELGGFGPTMALLAIGPALVAVLIIAFYPETAHRTLEEINPEDAVLDRFATPDS